MSQPPGLNGPASGPYRAGPGPRRPTRRSLIRAQAVLITLAVLGAGVWTWVIFLMIGIRGRRRAWLVWSAVYFVLAAAFVASQAGPDHAGTVGNIGVIPLFLAWFGGIVHIAVISADAAKRMGRANSPSLVAARERIERRAEGRRLAAKDPVLARELGVGRPDVPGADDYGLVDVNHAGPDALRRLPGITPQIAARIEEARQASSTFVSAEDLCVTLDLPPGLTDDLKEHAIFL